jgi:hypothetical protein
VRWESEVSTADESERLSTAKGGFPQDHALVKAVSINS